MDQYESFSPLDCEEPKALGAADGHINYPPTQSPGIEGPPLTILNQARADLIAADVDKNQDIHRHEEGLARQKQEFDGYETARENLETNRDLDISIIRGERNSRDGNHQPASSKLGIASQKLTQASSDLNEIKDRLGGRRFQSSLGPYIYLIIMCLLAFLEGPINFQGTEVILNRESILLSFFLTAIVSIVLISFAHLSGRFLKQRQLLGLGFSASIGIWTGAAILSFCAIAATSFIRYRWLQYLDIENIWGDLLFFLFVNISIFFVGLVIALLHYDTSSEYQSRTYAYRRAAKDFAKLDCVAAERESAIHTQFVENLKYLKQKHDRLAGEIHESEGKILRIKAMRAFSIQHVAYVIAMKLTAYAEGNRAERTDPLPKWLEAAEIQIIRQELVKEFCK